MEFMLRIEEAFNSKTHDDLFRTNFSKVEHIINFNNSEFHKKHEKSLNELIVINI